MTFDELADKFEQWYQDKCDNTRQAYSNSLRKLKGQLSGQDIAQIKGCEGTILDKRVLKRMLHLAVEWGYLDRVPIMRIPKEKSRTRFLDEDEIALLNKYVKDDDLRLMLQVAMATGLRKQNLFNLKWGQIDFNTHIIKVLAKGQKELYLPIPPGLSTALKDYRISRLVIGPDLPVFPIKAYDKRFRSILRALKIRGVSFHTLRHTFGSWLAMAGVDIKTIAELMGHCSIDTTQRYVHVSSEHKKEAVSRLPKSIFGG